MLLTYFILIIILAGFLFIFQKKKLTYVISGIFMFVQIIFLYYASQNIGKIILSNFTIDSLGFLFVGLLSLVSVSTIIHSYNHIKKATENHYALFFASIIALTGVLTGAYLANSLTVTWIFVEASTLFAALLIYHERGLKALEATWKYVFVCSFGIAFAYMGILFLMAILQATGSVKADIIQLSAIVVNANPIYLKIAFIFVLVGYSTKMELFPMHTVSIDANTIAPATGSAFISTTMANLGFLSILRVYGILAHNIEVHFWMNNVLMISGLGSILVAAGYMMKAQNNKRMLAYSTMENMGIAAIALGAGGLGYYAAILHVVIHTLIKSSFFFQMGQSSRIMGTTWIRESGNYMKKYALGAITILVAFISISAIPPSGLFISEYLTIKALIYNDLWWVLIPMLIFLCFIIYGMANRILYILYAEPKVEINFKPERIYWGETVFQLAILLFSMSFCFYRPEWLNLLIENGIKEVMK